MSKTFLNEEVPQDPEDWLAVEPEPEPAPEPEPPAKVDMTFRRCPHGKWSHHVVHMLANGRMQLDSTNPCKGGVGLVGAEEFTIPSDLAWWLEVTNTEDLVVTVDVTYD